METLDVASIFISFADRAGLLVEGAAVLIVVFGSAEAFARLVWTAWARNATSTTY